MEGEGGGEVNFLPLKIYEKVDILLEKVLKTFVVYLFILSTIFVFIGPVDP